MTRNQLPAVLLLAVVTGCFGPNQLDADDERQGTVRKSSKAFKPGDQGGSNPAPQGSGEGGAGGTAGGGGAGGTGNSDTQGSGTTGINLPSPTPFNGSTPPPGSPQSGLQIAFEELPRRWGIRPYLSRARAGHGAGVVGNRLMVVEGEHRPSLETLEYGSDRWILDDAHDAHLGIRTGAGLNRLQGASLGVAGSAFGESELWYAGGMSGILNADGSAGSPQIMLFQADGYRTKRGEEAAKTLIRGRYAAAGGTVLGNLVVAGGLFKPGEVLASVELVPLASNASATAGPPLPVPVAGAASAVAPDGKLYVAGGYAFTGGKATPVTSVQVYDGTAKTWKKSGDAGGVPSLPVPLHGAAAAVLDGVLYVAGGFDAQGKPLSSLYAFSLVAGDRWVPMIGMPTPRGLLSLTAFRGTLWAVGGVGADRKALQTVEAYQP